MKKVKKTSVMIILGIITPMVFLQLSCTTMKEKPIVEVSDEIITEVPEAAAKAPVAPLLLAGKHEAAGTSCNDCHEESPPENDVPNAVCLTCHEDYKELAASYIDPHDAHITYSSCGDCHHAHRPSENQCIGCHNFDLQVP